MVAYSKVWKYMHFTANECKAYFNFVFLENLAMIELLFLTSFFSGKSINITPTGIVLAIGLNVLSQPKLRISFP